MPNHPPRPCRQLYCPAIAIDSRGYCEKHKRVPYENAKERKKHQPGGDSTHKRLRIAAFHRDNGLCQRCLQAGRYTPATHAHHIKPVLEYPELKYDLDNLQSLCRECHEVIHGRKRG